MPTTTCVLLVHRIYAIDLAHDATVGERGRNSKFSTHHQDQSMEILATRERGVHLHTLEDRDAEALQEHDQSHTSHIIHHILLGHITSQSIPYKNKLDVL